MLRIFPYRAQKKRQLQPERYAPVYNLDDEVFFPSYHHSQNASWRYYNEY